MSILSKLSGLIRLVKDGVYARLGNVGDPIDELDAVNFRTLRNHSSLLALNGSDFGIKADGVTNDTPAFNSFMAACKAGQLRGELPKGLINLASKPNDIDFSWDLGGQGIASTIIYRDYNEAGTYTGCLNLVAGSSGTRIHDLQVVSRSGKTGGSMISATSESDYTISHIIFENLWLSTQGTDTHNATIVFDGSARTTGDIGIRDISLKNIHCFGADGFSVRLTSVIGLSWMGGGIYVAGGADANSGGMFISGTATEKTQYISVEVDTCAGFNMTQCTEMKLSAASIGTISGGVSVTGTASSTFIAVYGTPAGTVSGWASSGIRRPSSAWATS